MSSFCASPFNHPTKHAHIAYLFDSYNHTTGNRSCTSLSALRYEDSSNLEDPHFLLCAYSAFKTPFVVMTNTPPPPLPPRPRARNTLET